MMDRKDRQTDDPETCKSFGKGVIINNEIIYSSLTHRRLKTRICQRCQSHPLGCSQFPANADNKNITHKYLMHVKHTKWTL